MIPDPVSDAFDHGTFALHAPACLGDVRRYAVSLARHPPDTDDLAQETFKCARRYWHSFFTSRSCRRWLFALCRNTPFGGGAREQLDPQALERQCPHYCPTSHGDYVTGDVGPLAARQGY